MVVSMRRCKHRMCYRPPSYNAKNRSWEIKDSFYTSDREIRLFSWRCDKCDAPVAIFADHKIHETESLSY